MSVSVGYGEDPNSPDEPGQNGFSLVSEQPDHFVVQDNASGQQKVMAKEGIPDKFHDQIRSLPQVQKDTESLSPMSDLQSAQNQDLQAQMGQQQFQQVPEPPKMVPQQMDPYGLANQKLDLYKANMMKSQNAMAQAQASGFKQQADMWKQTMDQQQQEHDTYVKNWTDLTQKMDQTRQDVMNQKIDPGRFWKSKTGAAGFGSKVAAVLGMVLGGFAQNKTGVNPATAAINNLINQDIEAQKDNIGLKQNLLSDYYRQFGNMEVAHRATQMDMMNMVQAQLAQIAGNTQNNVVQQQAKQFGFELGEKIDEQKAALAQQKAQMENMSMLAGTQPGEPNLAMLPKEVAEKAIRIPDEFGGGFTVAHSTQDKEKLADAQSAYETLQDTIKEMHEHLDKGARGIIPAWSPIGGSASEKGDQLKKQAQGQLREMLDKIRPGSGTDAILNQVPDISIINQDKAKQSLAGLEAYARSILRGAYSTRTGRNFRGQESKTTGEAKPFLVRK